MLHIYLSDRAIRDLKLYANMAPKCLTALEDAIARFDSINELLKKTRIPVDVDIKRLRCQPTAWRHHFGGYRSIFTVSRIWGADSIQVLRIAPRANVYRRLASYLRASNEIVKLWNNPECDEDKILDWQLSEEQILSYYKEDDRYIEKCKLQVCQLRGAAGTGKTTSAFDLAIEAIDQGAYPIIIVPNRLLQKFGEDYITKNHQGLTICKNLSQTQSNKEALPTKLAIFTKDQILQYLSGDEREAWSNTIGNLKIRTYLHEKRVEIPDYLKNINLYNLFLGYVGNGYTQNNTKDALLREYKQGIEFISQPNYQNFIRKSLDKQDAVSQANRAVAVANRKKFIEIITQLTGHSDQPEDSDTFDYKVPILIIDEVQDFYWSQLQALIEFYILRFPMDDRTSSAPTVCQVSDKLKVSWESVSNHAGRLIILAGDNNQRVTFSGFSWENFATTFATKFPNHAPPVAPEAFLKNHRNTQQITRAANYILSAQETKLKAFELNTDGSSWITTPPSPEYSRVGKTTPRLIKADKEWISQLVSQLKDTPSTAQMEESESFVFIYDEISYGYEESQGDKLKFLNVSEAKGREFDAVVIIFPFALSSQQPSISQLFKWYTSLTRAREYVALLLSPAEWDWLHEKVINPNDLDSVFSKSSSLSVDEFIQELYEKGRSNLTEEERIGFIVDNIFRKIETLLIGNQKSSHLLEEIECSGLMIWQVLDAIEDRDNRFTTNLIIPPNISLEKSSPLEALIIYLAILPILIEMEIPNISTIDTQMINKLEQYFKQNSEEFDLAKSEVKNPISLCLIYRANKYSRQAASEIENCPSNHAKKFLLNQINQDLIKRDLSWEASRFRYRYLGEEPKENLPYRELIMKDEYLPRMLVEKIFEDINEFSK